MTAPISKIKQFRDKLQEIIDVAENRETNEVETNCNTYGLNEFIAIGSYGYLNLNADIEELISAPEFDDDME